MKKKKLEQRSIKFNRNDSPSERPVGYLTPETYQFMTERYVVLRDFIPEDIIEFALDTWKCIETNDEFEDLDIREPENSPTLGLERDSSEFHLSHGMYNSPWGAALSKWICNKLSEIIDIPIIETYSYSRKYDRGATLRPHTDRPSCEISTTFPLAYKTDDGKPWKIWIRADKNYVYDQQDSFHKMTQGVPISERSENNCYSVELELGDILLYQGPNAIHWRERLMGDYSYHVFVHFVSASGRMASEYNALESTKTRSDLYMRGSELASGSVNAQHDFTQHPLKYDGRESRYHSGRHRSDLWKDFDHRYYNTNKELQGYTNDYDFLNRIEEKNK